MNTNDIDMANINYGLYSKANALGGINTKALTQPTDRKTQNYL